MVVPGLGVGTSVGRPDGLIVGIPVVHLLEFESMHGANVGTSVSTPVGVSLGACMRMSAHACVHVRTCTHLLSLRACMLEYVLGEMKERLLHLNWG